MSETSIRTNTKRYITLGILFVLLLSAGVLFLRLQGSVKLKARIDYLLQSDVVFYQQDDSNWANVLLGDSQYTMESSGCLVTCIAAAITMNGKEIAPDELNQLFSENMAYDNAGNLQWTQVDEITGFEVAVYSEISNEVIETCLKEKKYPIVRVRMHGIGNFHYVLIIGSESGEYLCMDPLSKTITRLSEYGERVYAIRCVWYEKPANIALYEKYYQMEYANGDYLYTYHDCDENGELELLIKKHDTSEIFDIMKYEKHGLRYAYMTYYKDICVDSLSWYDNLNTYTKAEKYSGIIVDETTTSPMEYYWYPDEETFLEDFGFAGIAPFYEHRDINRNIYMALYYNEQTTEGCGILYSEYGRHHGFVFKGISEIVWEGSTDYFALESVYGDNGKADITKDYQENYEYNADGKITHFDSSGFSDWYGDGSERLTVLALDFMYDENGYLKQRHYQHGGWLFGYSYMSWDSYFDELERVTYECIYITHGTQENFYIYSKDNLKPDYLLIVDPGWGVEFIKYS